MRRVPLSPTLKSRSLTVKESASGRTPWGEGKPGKACGCGNELRTVKDQNEDGCGRSSGQKGGGEMHPVTRHLKFLPSDLHKCRLAFVPNRDPLTRQCFLSYFSWQVKNMKNKDKRLKIMNEILSGIKVRS